MNSNINNSSSENEKGICLVTLSDDYVVLDLETTGLNTITCEIIEISACKYRANKLVDTFSTLVKPDLMPSTFITNLTGITPLMLAGAPKIKDIISDFYSFIDGEIIMGHNVTFDIGFLNENFKKHLGRTMNNNYLDTMRISRKTLPSLAHHRLVDLVSYYNIETKRAHRALDDVLATQCVYMHLREDIEKNNVDLSKPNNKKYSHLNVSEIVPDENKNINEKSIFYKKTFVFTGELKKYTRREAAQIVVNRGAITSNTLSSKTNYLVIGNTELVYTTAGKKTTKMIKAEELINKGYDLRIITENMFYEMIELDKKIK